MSPSILNCIGRNWRTSAFVLWMIVAGPMCGNGGGSGGGGGAPPATFNVVLTFPANTATNVARTQSIYLTVNGAVNPATLAGSITVTGTVPIAINTVWNPVLSQIEIIPQGATFMQSNVTHLVSVTSGVQTMTGTSMVPMMFSFTTITSTDVTVPTFAGATGAVTAGGAAAVDTITLSWAAGSDGGGTPVGSLLYDVYLATISGQVNYAANPVATSAAGATSVNVTSLGSNTAYFFVVRCRDAAGNRDANTVQRTAKTNVRFSTDIYNGIVNNPATGHCTICHTVGGQSAFMDLSLGAPDVVVNQWVNVAAAAGTGPSPLPSCGGAGRIRVIPGDPANSLVFQKVAPPGPGIPPCGVRMPEDGATNGFLTGVQIQTISDWITQGAPNN